MILNILVMVVAALLIAVILMQNQGTGLSASFGGGGDNFRSRRSMDKALVYATVILATAFALLSIVLLLPR